MITSLSQLDRNKYYTYADYVIWQFKERVELLKGRLWPLAAPSVRHHEVSSRLHVAIGSYLRTQPCKIFAAPFDVRLPLPAHKATPDKIDTVVQPDLCVICDLSKLDEQGCIGAPEIVVEILSPGNSRREMKEKFALYEAAGVKEYWVIDPVHNLAFVYALDAATHKYIATVPVLTDEDTLVSTVLSGFTIALQEVFPEAPTP